MKYLISSFIFLLGFTAQAEDVVNQEPAHQESVDQEVTATSKETLRVTMHMLENGEKKSSRTLMTTDGGSADHLKVTNNSFERSFVNAEVLDSGRVIVRMHDCSGAMTAEYTKNMSAINCRPEEMNRKTFEASLGKSAIVETQGPQGQKQEYFIFVEKVSQSKDATTL